MALKSHVFSVHQTISHSHKFSGLAQYVLLWTMIIMKEIHSLLYHLIGMYTKIKQQIICNRKTTFKF